MVLWAQPNTGAQICGTPFLVFSLYIIIFFYTEKPLNEYTEATLPPPPLQAKSSDFDISTAYTPHSSVTGISCSNSPVSIL